MREHCAGKIVEIRNLFNLIERSIDIPVLLEKFNNDLESYNSFDNSSIEKAWIDEVTKRAENLDTSDTLSYKDFFDEN